MEKLVVDLAVRETFYHLIGQILESEAAWTERQATLRNWRADPRFEPCRPSIDHVLADDFVSFQRRVATLKAVGPLGDCDYDAWCQQRDYDSEARTRSLAMILVDFRWCHTLGDEQRCLGLRLRTRLRPARSHPERASLCTKIWAERSDPSAARARRGISVDTRQIANWPSLLAIGYHPAAPVRDALAGVAGWRGFGR
jgi:hypothetical protein